MPNASPVLNSVVHFEIVSKDPDALGHFFFEVFGWTINPLPGGGAGNVPRYLMALPSGDDPPKAGINGGFGGIPEGYDGHVTFYVAVEDVAAALDTVEKHGGTRMMGPDQVPGGPIIGLFKDPQDHTIGLVDISSWR
jgi:predicted enzyme related to lactoylglutathione lyase